MSEQRQAAIRRLRREAELLRKAIEVEFSRASAPGGDRASCRSPRPHSPPDYRTPEPETTDYRTGPPPTRLQDDQGIRPP